MPDSFTQEGLLHEFKDQFTNQSILIPCSKQARDKLAKELMKWDNQVQVLHLYEPVTNIENVRKVHELIQHQEVTHVTFSSSSAVSSYFDNYHRIPNSVEVYAIGAITERKLNTYRQPSKVAEEYTLEGMINTILKEVKS